LQIQDHARWLNQFVDAGRKKGEKQ